MSNRRQDRPSTYFVQDRANKEELHRLQLQDQMMTASMGGVLPEQLAPTAFERVLDVGCGTGTFASLAVRQAAFGVGVDSAPGGNEIQKPYPDF